MQHGPMQPNECSIKSEGVQMLLQEPLQNRPRTAVCVCCSVSRNDWSAGAGLQFLIIGQATPIIANLIIC